MLTVPDAALWILASALGQIEDPRPESACSRLVPKGDGKLALTMNAPAPDDAEYEYHGSTVLVVSDAMHNLTLT
jgi:hypothetical protein